MFLGDAAFMPLQLSSLSAAVPSLQLPKMAWCGGSSIHTSLALCAGAQVQPRTTTLGGHFS